MSVVERIIHTARQQGYTQVALAEALKEHRVTKQTITDWKAGKSNSYYLLIVELAELLGVTTDYLLTGRGLSVDEETLLEGYRVLNEADQQTLLSELERLKQGVKVKKILSDVSENGTHQESEKPVSELLSPDMRRKILELLEEDDD